MSIKIILYYLLAINIIGAIVNIVDKQKAIHNKWRIKESTLWLVAILGGAPLSYLTMKAIRHKTKHKSFMIGFPIISILEIVLIIYLMGG